MENLKCAKCGNEVPAGSAFCTNCGTPVNAAPQQNIPPQNYGMQNYAAYQKPPVKVKDIVKYLGLIGVGVNALTDFILSFMTYSSGSGVFYDFLQAIGGLGVSAFWLSIVIYMLSKMENK